MTTADVQLKTGEVLRDLPLDEAGDLVSAGHGQIVGFRTPMNLCDFTPPTTTVKSAVTGVPRVKVTSTSELGRSAGRKR